MHCGQTLSRGQDLEMGFSDALSWDLTLHLLKLEERDSCLGLGVRSVQSSAESSEL